MSSTPASRIIEDRLDMTKWVLHFVHEGDIKNAPGDQLMPFEEYGWYPYHEDRDINYRFSDWDIMDESSTLEPDAHPMAVLRKIVTDGISVPLGPSATEGRRSMARARLSVSLRCRYTLSLTTRNGAARPR